MARQPLENAARAVAQDDEAAGSGAVCSGELPMETRLAKRVSRAPQEARPLALRRGNREPGVSGRCDHARMVADGGGHQCGHTSRRADQLAAAAVALLDGSRRAVEAYVPAEEVRRRGRGPALGEAERLQAGHHEVLGAIHREGVPPALPGWCSPALGGVESAERVLLGPCEGAGVLGRVGDREHRLEGDPELAELVPVRRPLEGGRGLGAALALREVAVERAAALGVAPRREVLDGLRERDLLLGRSDRQSRAPSRRPGGAPRRAGQGEPAFGGGDQPPPSRGVESAYSRRVAPPKSPHFRHAIVFPNGALRLGGDVRGLPPSEGHSGPS